MAVKQKLAILANKNKKEADDVKVVSATVAEEWFKNKDYLFESGEDRTITVNIYVPVSLCKYLFLFATSCPIDTKVYLGNRSDYKSYRIIRSHLPYCSIVVLGTIHVSLADLATIVHV